MKKNPKPPIFITARFRTGSTMIWNIFRQIPDVVAFYEPLHGQLPEYIAHPTPTRDEHLYVKSYFDEYRLANKALALYSTDYSFHRLFLDENEDYPELKEYIQALIDTVPSSKTCVIKFNRVDFRLAWLKRHFPNSRLLHLTRNPRSQWYSSVSKYGEDVNNPEMDAFFINTFARDLYRQFPFLAGKYIEHPYQRFYYLWKISLLLGQAQSHISLSYEDFLAAPETNLLAILNFAGLDQHTNYDHCIQYIESRPKRAWNERRDEDWFLPHETKCEQLLDDLGLNQDLGLHSLSDIQSSSRRYQDMLSDPENDRWAFLSLKRALSRELNISYILGSDMSVHNCPYRVELENLKNSRSWKLTGPFRSLLAVMRKIQDR